MVEMLGIDVGDDRDRPVEPQEAAVAFIGFDHHPLGLAQSGVGAIAVDDPAIDHRRVHPPGVEQASDHRRGRGLPVRPSDRDGRLHPHQFGQHFRAPDPGQPPLDRGNDFRIVGLDRGRADDHLRVPQIVGRMADHHRDSDFSEPFDDIVFRNVRSLDRIAQLVHHLGDPRHADSANANEVDGPHFGAHRFHAGAPRAIAGAALADAGPTGTGDDPPAIRSTRSARSLAALGRPTDSARPAALASASGS